MGEKHGMVRLGVRVCVTSLVECFVSASTNSLLQNVAGGKIAKLAAKAGGLLAGLYLGDKVTDYICDSFDQMIEDIDDMKAENEEEDVYDV